MVLIDQSSLLMVIYFMILSTIYPFLPSSLRLFSFRYIIMWAISKCWAYPFSIEFWTQDIICLDSSLMAFFLGSFLMTLLYFYAVASYFLEVKPFSFFSRFSVPSVFLRPDFLALLYPSSFQSSTCAVSQTKLMMSLNFYMPYRSGCIVSVIYSGKLSLSACACR